MSGNLKTEASIFSRAIEIENDADRSSYIRRACAGDAQQEARIQRLIRANRKIGDLLDIPDSDVVPPIATLVERTPPGKSPESLTKSAPPGTTLGDFRLVREIARGGMGVVYEAEQISLHRRVAVKVLPFAAVLDQRQLKRFQTEAQAAAALDHPHIVNVHSVGCDRGVHYYAMQYVDGHDAGELIRQLRDISTADLPPTDAADFALALSVASGEFQPQNATRRISLVDPHAPTTTDGGSVPPYGTDVPRRADDTHPFAMFDTKECTSKSEFFRTIAGLGIQAAEALEYAHQHGVLHRDIKPSNLMLDADGKLLVTDFGLARVEGDAALTMTGDVMGTLRYMSPEQASGNNVAVDVRSDVFSLGVTLYELLTLQPLYSGSDHQELLRKRAEEDPVPPRRINKAIPADLETVILKAISKRPDNRYATAQEFADDLRRFVNNEPVLARRPTLTTRIVKWGQRNRALALSFATAFIGGIVAASVIVVIRDQHGNKIAEVNVPEGGTVGVELREHGEGKAPALGLASLNEDNQLPGLIPHPKKIDGLGRWQIITNRPCRFPVHFWSLEVSPDSRYVAFGEGHDVRVYTVPELDLVRIFGGHTNRVIKVAWSPDGRWLASASDDNTVRMWNVETGIRGPILVGHQDRVNAVAWHPEGTILASGCHDGEVRFWTVDGKPERIGRSHTSEVRSVSWSPDGSRLASTGKDGTIRLWDETGQLKSVIDSKAEHIRSVAWRPDGQQLATTHHGANQVRLWGVDGTPGPVLQGHKNIVTAARWSLDGKTLVSAGWDGTIREWNSDGTAGPVRIPSDGHILDFAWSPDGAWMVSALADRIQLSTLDGTPGPELKIHPSVRSVSWQPGGDKFAANVGQANSFFVGIWNADATSSYLVSDAGEHPLSFDWSPDGEQLALAGWEPALRLCKQDGTAGRLIGPQGPDAGASRIVWSPNGRQIAARTSSETGETTIQLWNQDGTAGPELSMKRHALLYGMAWNPRGDRLAEVTFDGKLYLWSSNGELEKVFQIGQLTESVAWKPDGMQIATGSDDGTIRLWTPDGQPVALLKGHDNRASGIAWSPDGQWIASGSRDSRIRLWTAAGRPVATLKGHRGGLGREISWYPHQLQFLSSGLDGTIRLWDAATQQQLWILQVFADGQSVKFAPDGRLLAGDPTTFDREFICIIEQPNGAFQILKPSEFRQRYQQEMP